MFDKNFDFIPDQIKDKTFVVGGAVRDKLLGQEPNDLDFVTENVQPSTLKDLGLEEVGVSNFPVFLLENGDELALTRKEQKSGKGYKGFEFSLGNTSIREDLFRRDLSINGIAFDITNEEIIDPFDGRSDIEDQKLRHISKHFLEDPIRVMRLARFASRLPNFDIASETISLAKEVVSELEEVPNERIGDEVRKTFKQAEKPRRFFDVLDTVGALEVTMPTVAKLREVPAGTESHHKEGTAFEHTMMVLEELQNLSGNNIREMFSALAHDLGKAETPEDILPMHHGHDTEHLELVDQLAESLKLSNELKGCMKTGMKHHMRVTRLLDMKDSKVIRLVKELDSGKSLTIDELCNLVRADALGRKPSSIDMDMDAIEQRLRTAKSVVENFDGNTVARNNPDKSGQQLGQLIEQRQIENLRERLG